MSERQILRGFIANVSVVPPLIVTFQFNPTSISDNKDVVFAEITEDLGDTAPRRVYMRGGDRTINFDFQLHGLEQGTNVLNPTGIDNGISTELAKLRSFLYPRADAWAVLNLPFGANTDGIVGDTGRIISGPPTCFFGFGTRVLECVITDIRIQETQFNSALAPVRADVSITMVVIEEKGNAFYEADRHHRNALSLLGIQNIRLF